MSNRRRRLAESGPREGAVAVSSVQSAPYSRWRLAALVGGPLAFALLLALPVPDGLSPAGWRVAALALLMAVWWLSEAIPIPATALLPVVFLPVLDVVPVNAATAPYANPIVFLFLGGFLLALGMQRWNLHKRIALTLVRRVGTGPRRIVLGFLAATSFLSMWVSNTATAMMMLPIGLSVAALLDTAEDDRARDNFRIALLLAIAYGANVGGIGTLIGTPPNALLAGFLDQTYGVQIGFGQWMLFGLPLVLIGQPLIYTVLMRRYPLGSLRLAGGAGLIDRQLRDLGPMSRPEWTVAAVFAAVALLWILGPLLEPWVSGLSDAGIAMAGALALFLIPAGRGRGSFVLDWAAVERLPWGVLILFGGGLSLANAIQVTGLADYVGQLLAGLEGLPVVLVMLLVGLTVLLLTEVSSNTATAAAFLPVVAALAIALGENPLLLAVPAAVVASCAFMLPVATPPNAIVFGSGFVPLQQMLRTGVWLGASFVLLATLLAYVLTPLVFGVEPGRLPAWATGG